ncbi:hypothetical protein V2J09_007517 [Rumex salicifolius]
MAEIGFSDLTASRPSGGFKGPGRDFSPDSVIYTLDSNFSLFSSASASVDRCSFASDVHDRDSPSSDFSQHLAGQEIGGRKCLSSQDLDLPHLNKVTVLNSANGYLGKKAVKAEVEKHQDNNVPVDVDGDAPNLDSARNSFSLALKECQERRSRSEANANKVERWRPAPLDLSNSAGNVASSSPRLGAMNKNTVLSRKSGNLPSPGTPNYFHASGGMNKGWSSERVPLQTSFNRRQGGTVVPFNNGRTLPSKWEDAERWILSPLSGDGMRPLYQQPQRRQKSKSGPLGAPGIAYYSMYSPGISMYDENNVNNTIAASPFSTGVMMTAAASIRSGNNGNFHSTGEPCIARSVSVHGCSDLICQSSGTYFQDEKVGNAKDAAANVCRTVSRRDMATQMSPVGSAHSSSRNSSFSVSTPSILPVVEVQSFNSSKPEVRDVRVDERVTVTRWSKKHKSRISGKGSERMDDWQLKAVEPSSSAWQNLEASKSLSNCQSEEAKIAAWENLQKAKAEAAIRKLEMKLEKKRSASMEKIMKKLRSAQKKAQEMRASTNQANQSPKTSFKVVSFSRTRKMSSLSGCFTCHAF